MQAQQLASSGMASIREHGGASVTSEHGRVPVVASASSHGGTCKRVRAIAGEQGRAMDGEQARTTTDHKLMPWTLVISSQPRKCRFFVLGSRVIVVSHR
jgi:hypothetical protein